MTEHTGILFTQNVEVALKNNLVRSDGALFCRGAQDVHGTQVLNCGRIFDNDVLLSASLAFHREKGKWSHNRQHLEGTPATETC